MNDWENQLALLLGQQDQPQEDYWGMMAANDQTKLPAAAQWGGPMMDEALRQMELGNKQKQPQVQQPGAQTGLATDRGGSGYKTPTQKQLNDARLMEMLRRRALPSQ